MAATLTAVPWVAVAVSDLQNARPGALVTAFDATALGPGQTNRTTVAIAKYTAELLAAVGYSGRVVMDASQGTVSPDVVPPNLFDPLVEKICRQLEKSLGMPWTADETSQERDYAKLLQALMKGEVAVFATSNPGNAASISSKGGSVATICAPRRQFQPSPGGFGGGGGFCGGNPL